MSKHEQISELLVGFALGELSEHQSAQVKAHLVECQQCNSELKQLQALLQCAANRRELSADQQACESAKKAIFAVVANRETKEPTPRLTIRLESIRRTIMKSTITKLATAAAIIVAVVLGLHLFNPLRATVTFADVIKPILNARTVVLDLVIGKEEAGPVIHDIVVGSKIRRTFSNIDTIMIIDMDSARMLLLDPQSKSAVYADIEGPLQQGTKNFVEFVRKAVNNVKELPAQELGQRDIDGHKAIGFKAIGPNEEITVWADLQTAKPIRIELLLMGQSLYILKNIGFDVPVDESLVSMDLPAGYVSSDKQFDMRQFTEQDFVAVLRFWAAHLLAGSFPENLSIEVLMNLVPGIGEKIDQLQISEGEKAQLGAAFGRGVVFFQQLDPNGIKWHYAGSGVKLGDASKAIFWYQPKGSPTYRVIYGDLSVKDVEPENLPK